MKSTILCYKNDKEVIHRTFQEFKEDPLFEEFSWKDDGRYPYSELLESSITSLHVASLLTWVDLRYIMIRYKQQERIAEGIHNKFSPLEKEVLKFIAHLLHERLEKE